MKHPKKDESLRALVKNEQAAVETYKQALSKVGDDQKGKLDLRRIVFEHEEALNVLQDHLSELAIEPPEDYVLWDDWAKAAQGGSSLFANESAIKALMSGEEREAHEYENALRNEALDAEIRQLISTELLPRTRAHISILDRFLDGPGGSAKTA